MCWPLDLDAARGVRAPGPPSPIIFELIESAILSIADQMEPACVCPATYMTSERAKRFNSTGMFDLRGTLSPSPLA